jgi:WD40 repeat protein
MLTFAATGRAPFDAGNFTATSYAVVNKPPDLRSLTQDAGIAGVPLRAAALSPDGRFAAMIDDVRCRVYLASLDDPARPDVLDGTDLTITGVAFAGSGMLAMGGSDGSLRLWHTARHSMRTIRTAGSPVTAVAASPNGTRLVISDKRSALRSFDAVNGSLEPGWVVDSAEPAEYLAFRAGETRLASAGDTARIWNAADGTQIGMLPGRTGRARAVAADHDGKRIAVAWAETVITVWDGKRLLWELTGHKGAVLASTAIHLPDLHGYLRDLTGDSVTAATSPVKATPLPRTREFPSWTPRPPRHPPAIGMDDRPSLND